MAGIPLTVRCQDPLLAWRLGQERVADALSRLPDTDLTVVSNIVAANTNRKIHSHFQLGASTNVAAVITASDHPLQSVLASCQPSSVHLLPEHSGLDDVEGHMCVSANRSVYQRCGLQAPRGGETRAGTNHWDARTCFDSEPESIDLAMSSHSAAACRLCRICMLTLTGCHTGADVEEGHWALSAMCVRSSRLWVWMASSIGSCF